jgi:hypothetical protein
MSFPLFRLVCRPARSPRGLFLAVILTAAGVPLTAAPSLREVLTPAEFERAGLGKLTPDELEFLGQRLLGAPAPEPRTPPAPPAASEAHGGAAGFGREEALRRDFEEKQAIPREIHSRLPGPFAGWAGQTRFHLENGQVWQQVEPGLFSVVLDSPAVTIRRGRLGAFYLGVDGYGSRVKVRRVQ